VSFRDLQGDFPAHLAALRTPVGGAGPGQREGGFDKNSEFSGINQPGNLAQLTPAGANEQKRVTNALFVSLCATGGNSYQPAVRFEHTPGAFQGLAAHGVEHDIDVPGDFFEASGAIIHYLFRPQLPDEVQVGGGGRGDDVRPTPARQLHGEDADATGCAMDQDTLTALHVGFFQKTLPGCQRRDRGDGGLGMIQQPRFTTEGEFVPLDQQDTTLWSQPMMDEAERHLQSAAVFKQLGRYQLEAAIQSIHASRAKTGDTDWRQIALLYEGLVRIAPGIGSLVGRAVAIAQAGDVPAGLAALEQLPSDRVANYQPYWAARGHLLSLLERTDEAQQAFTRAAGLTDDPALRQYLFRRADAKA
jgi:hypothetical protein